MREVIDQLLTRVTCHLSVFWITQGRPRICCGEKHRTKTLILKKFDFSSTDSFRFPVPEVSLNQQRGLKKRIIFSKRARELQIFAPSSNVRKTSTTLLTSAPISLSMLQVSKNVKIFKILLRFFVQWHTYFDCSSHTEPRCRIHPVSFLVCMLSAQLVFTR